MPPGDLGRAVEHPEGTPEPSGPIDPAHTEPGSPVEGAASSLTDPSSARDGQVDAAPVATTTPVSTAPAETPAAPGAVLAPAAGPGGTSATSLPTPGPSDARPDLEESDHDHGPLPALVLAALGIVFGDIGTSPLYSLQTVFSIQHNAVQPTVQDVRGIISLVFWSVMAVVSFKYVALVMRADNNGEGGILALTALLRRTMRSHRSTFCITLLGIVGAGLFYGDSFITPAISVMSAVEGLQVVDPGAEELVLPVSVVILTLLFLVQRKGTSLVGAAFGPVMVLWFLTLGLLGIPHIVAHPGILTALSPADALTFVRNDPGVAFIAMGAIVLTITGAEALYADMGHFGAKPIRIAWFAVVLPCLILNYLGQGALIISEPDAVGNPFFRLVPGPLVVPVVILATLATVIASQAVISGAFSVSQQALHLGLLPRLDVRHTSKKSGGQIYVPLVNWVLYVGVLVLVLGFESSAALANAYGLAVTGTLMLTTVLFLGLADKVWHWPMWLLVVLAVVIGGLEVTFFGANLTKILHGGWLPVLIAGVVIFLMTTWLWGSQQVKARRDEFEGPLDRWLAHVREAGVARVPGQSIYLHSNLDTVPLALKETLRFYHVLHEKIAIVSVQVLNVPHVRHVERVSVTDLGDPNDGIVGITIKLGFNDSQDVPHNLKWSIDKHPEFDWDARGSRYFLSVLQVRPGEARGWKRFRRGVFVMLTRNAGSRVDAFHLPPSRTAIFGGRLSM